LAVRVYLVQHGEAKREEEDPSRPLTDRGREEVKRVAEFLARAGVKVGRILHSGKLRAQQTAEIMAGALKPDKGVERAEALEPLADPRVWLEKLSGIDEDVMLVGHLPHLSKLASLLLTGKEDAEPVAFRMGGVVCLERGDSHVEKVYRRFMERFPTPRALHAAAEEEVRRMITPLGLENRRARQLKQLAKVLVEKHGGRVPSELDDLLCLPGVGRYTAAEVLLACFDVPEPLLDVNMKRLIGRVFGLQGVSEEELWEFAKRLVPQDPVEARKFNYGVLDFAQAVCKARRPRCGECPLNDVCSWATSGRPQTK